MKLAQPFGSLLFSTVLILCAFFMIISGINLMKELRLAISSKSWILTDAVLTHLVNPTAIEKFKVWPGDKIAAYSYQVGDTQYQGNTLSFTRRTKWTPKVVKEEVQLLKQMKPFQIYYDPANPSHSVVKTDGPLWPTVLFIFSQVAVSAALFWFSINQFRNIKQAL